MCQPVAWLDMYLFEVLVIQCTCDTGMLCICIPVTIYLHLHSYLQTDEGIDSNYLSQIVCNRTDGGDDSSSVASIPIGASYHAPSTASVFPNMSPLAAVVTDPRHDGWKPTPNVSVSINRGYTEPQNRFCFCFLASHNNMVATEP